MYATALDRLWHFIWVDHRFFGLRTLGDNERHRGWTTWLFWLAFWLLFPILLFCALGFVVSQISASLGWGLFAFFLLFCMHGLAIWARLKNATDAIVGDPVQASWISSTLASLALLAACFIGLAVVSFASFSAGMSVSLFDLSNSGEQQKPTEPKPKEVPTLDDPDKSGTFPPITKEPLLSQTVDASEVQTNNNLPVWWRVGDSSMPVVGFDATPVGDNSPWEHSELCRPGTLVIFSRSSSDGPLVLNNKLSRERAETLLSMLNRFVEGCAIDRRPNLMAVSLGKSLDSWHDGAQRVVKLSLLPAQNSVDSRAVLDSETLSAIGESIKLSISRFERVEVCSLNQESICEWHEFLDSP